jgi:uncharacterized membrane protein
MIKNMENRALWFGVTCFVIIFGGAFLNLDGIVAKISIYTAFLFGILGVIEWIRSVIHSSSDDRKIKVRGFIHALSFMFAAAIGLMIPLLFLVEADISMWIILIIAGGVFVTLFLMTFKKDTMSQSTEKTTVSSLDNKNESLNASQTPIPRA